MSPTLVFAPYIQFLERENVTNAGGAVEIKTSRVASSVYINVQDISVGIAPEQIEHVFERFSWAEQSRSHWAGGAGLGLAIALPIAENQGSAIAVTSELGFGSYFTVGLRPYPN